MARKDPILKAVVVCLLALATFMAAVLIIPVDNVEAAPAPGWIVETPDSTGLVGMYSSMELDSMDKAHISYYDQTNTALKYATNSGGSWASVTLDEAGEVGLYSSLAIDSNDKVHISYFDSTNANLKYATNAGGGWAISTVDSSADNVGSYTSIDVDNNDKVHISYYDLTNKDLKYANNMAGSWAIITVDSTGNVGSYSAIGVDSSSYVHIAYYNESGSGGYKNLKYTSNIGGTWNWNVIDATTSDMGRYASLVMDSNDKVHISYCCYSCQKLSYATNANGVNDFDFDRDYPDYGQVGWFTSIALDSNDKPYISYYDIAYNDLLTVEKTGTYWSGPLNVTGDGASIVGTYSSIAIKSNGKICISFYDSTASDLCYVMQSSVPLAPTLLSANSGDQHNVLTWTTPTDNGGSSVTGYKLYRGTTSGNESILTTLGTVLTFNDTGLTNGQIYYYKVRAVSALGDGEMSNELNATPSTVSTAPQNLHALSGDAFVALDWGAPSNNGGAAISNYQVWRGSTSGGETLLIEIGNTLAYNDTSALNGQTYYYVVKAKNVRGLSTASNEVTGIPIKPISTPSSPRNLVATPGNGQVSLTWNAPLDDGGEDVTAYKVYRGTTSGSEGLRTTLGNVLSFTDTGLTNGQTYYYYVKAVNVIGDGQASDEVSSFPRTTPSAPTINSATPGNGQVELVWTSPNDGGASITGFILYRGTASGTETKLLDLGNVVTYTDSGLTNGQEYFYKVTAKNSAGESAYSNEVSATPATVPSAPLGLGAVADDGKVSLTWSAPSEDGGDDITGYHVYRGTSSGDLSLIAELGNVLLYNDVGLTNGQEYYYVVTAQNDRGEGVASAEVSATPETVPSAPVITSATPSDGQVVLVWTSPDDGGADITGYVIYRGTEAGAETELTELGVVLTYTDNGLTNGQTYFYTVSAVNGVGEGAHSIEVSATPASEPSAPSDLIAIAGDGVVDLSWEAPSYVGPGPITYHLFRNDVLIWNGSSLAHSDSEVTNDVTYTYKVAAQNSIGWGPNCTSVQATPGIVVPTAPRGLVATEGNGFVEITWISPEQVGSGTLTFYLFRDGTVVYSGTEIGFVDDNLQKGVLHTYTVAALNAVGWGPNSSAITAMSFGVPDAPWGLAGIMGNGEAQLSWNAVNYSGPGLLVYHLFQDGVEVYNGSDLSFADLGLINGQTYLYVLSANNSVGTSAFSEAITVTPQGPPSAPMGLIAAPGDGWVRLSWSIPGYISEGNIIYHLFRDDTEVWSGLELAFNDTDVSNDVTYVYTVAAQSSLGWSPNSTEVLGMPEGPSQMIPGPPTGLVATPGDGTVSLTWQAPTENASSVTGYNVYRKSGQGAWELIATVTGTSYNDENVNNGQEYSYKVSSVGSGEEGDPTESAVIIPQSSDSDNDEGNNALLFLGIGVLAIAAVLALLFVMRRKKK